MNKNPLTRRVAGVLLHPTSLPGSPGNGDLGDDAFQFVDLLADHGFSLWQTLPLGPTHGDLSPYQCQSVHAGSYKLINLQKLVDAGWLDEATISETEDINVGRRNRLQQASDRFHQSASVEDQQAYNNFVKEHSFWLDDFALYQALRQNHDGKAWFQWPSSLRDREPSALLEAGKKFAEDIGFAKFEQFAFYRQWLELRQYANNKGVMLFGDIPIFVAHDSADVWANPEWFSTDEKGELTIVAGVPPDYFSETGQRWGNPLYNWDQMEQTGYQWWIDRVGNQTKLFDILRIDHFRGFEAAWEIPASEETAINGQWVKGPGMKLFSQLQQALGDLPLVAEDLGVITEEVNELRQGLGLPGMKILHFAFGGDADNPYLPHNHEKNCAVYTGTHDNNTTVGWWNEQSDEEQGRIRKYFGHPSDDPHWILIRAAYASVANLMVMPMQDILGLGQEDRMNIPGVAEGNWRWRFEWSQVDRTNFQTCLQMGRLYGRSR
ncbi:MAG: 4-alpha-glucanotransferase [Gammaproteobacteria bacterium]